jgi:hypothetical protein
MSLVHTFEGMLIVIEAYIDPVDGTWCATSNVCPKQLDKPRPELTSRTARHSSASDAKHAALALAVSAIRAFHDVEDHLG